MPSHLIAEDAFVITARGVMLVGEVAAGADDVLVVRGGALTLAPTREAITHGEHHRAWRLLTPVGDILIAEGSFVMTREGPLSGHDIEVRVASGRAVRVEVVGPTDLPATASHERSLNHIYRSCLLSIPGQTVQVPRNGADELAEDDIVRCLDEADVDYRCFRDERWLAFRFDAPAPIDHDDGPYVGHHADGLLSLTAWEPNGSGTASRIRFEDSLLRRRVLASLAGGHRGFEVKWLPAYRPIECRVYERDPRLMKPFVPVQAALLEEVRVRRLEIGQPGHLVLGLAVVAARA
jgi:hypothetical protein